MCNFCSLLRCLSTTLRWSSWSIQLLDNFSRCTMVTLFFFLPKTVFFIAWFLLNLFNATAKLFIQSHFALENDDDVHCCLGLCSWWFLIYSRNLSSSLDNIHCWFLMVKTWRHCARRSLHSIPLQKMKILFVFVPFSGDESNKYRFNAFFAFLHFFLSCCILFNNSTGWRI